MLRMVQQLTLRTQLRLFTSTCGRRTDRGDLPTPKVVITYLTVVASRTWKAHLLYKLV